MNVTNDPPGKVPSHLQQNLQGARSNPIQAGISASATVSTPPENHPSSNYQVTPFNTVNMEQFSQIIGDVSSDDPPSTMMNHNMSYTLPAQNSSNSVAIYQPTIQEPESELVLEEIVESGGSDSIKPINEQNSTPPTNMDKEPTDEENEEISNTWKQDKEHIAEASRMESDTPSPIDYNEGQIYILNNSMQFVRFHAKIGDKYMITNKGLQKIEEDEQITPQVLTLKGKFSFKFESN
jgi:hypothetical protein